MTTLTTDQKYSDLISELDILNRKFDKFINGNEDETVQIEGSRNIKTLSGITADLHRFKYVQKVIDHRLLQDAIDDDIEIGMLVRIWGDTDKGIYKKDAEGNFNKISYSDLYDLKDFLPNPWNYTSITKGPDKFNNPLELLSFKVPNSSFLTNPTRLSGKVLFSVDGVGNRGSYSFDFVINTTTGTGSQSDRLVVVLKSNVSTMPVDSNFGSFILPDISVTSIPGALETTYKITITNFLTSDGQTIIPARFTIDFLGIDKSYKLL